VTPATRLAAATALPDTATTAATTAQASRVRDANASQAAARETLPSQTLVFGGPTDTARAPVTPARAVGGDADRPHDTDQQRGPSRDSPDTVSSSDADAHRQHQQDTDGSAASLTGAVTSPVTETGGIRMALSTPTAVQGPPPEHALTAPGPSRGYPAPMPATSSTPDPNQLSFDERLRLALSHADEVIQSTTPKRS
jgi:hypothetical protein